MSNLKDQLASFESERQVNALADSQKEVQALINKMYEAKEASDIAEKNFKELKAQVLEVMEQAGIEKLSGDRCNLTCKDKTSNQLPKDVPLKLEVFKFMVDRMGQAALNNMLTINAASFNSWVTKEIESEKLKGNVEFEIPNVKPYTYKSLGIRRKAGK